MCNCKSYNKPEWGGTEHSVPVEYPFSTRTDGVPTVCIDPCIQHEIAALWAAGIQTAHSCCGHNQAGPDVGVVNIGSVPHAAHLLSKIDTRQWRVWCYSKPYGSRN